MVVRSSSRIFVVTSVVSSSPQTLRALQSVLSSMQTMCPNKVKWCVGIISIMLVGLTSDFIIGDSGVSPRSMRRQH